MLVLQRMAIREGRTGKKIVGEAVISTGIRKDLVFRGKLV
jgi:hypothetical protein